MPSFSKRSRDNLKTCHPLLQDVCNEAIKYIDFAVICGHRGKEAQEKAFREGNSKARWGESKHNSDPSLAVDLFPYPYDWDDRESFRVLADCIMGIAERQGINLVWGGNFRSISDMPHFELQGLTSDN